MSRRRNKGRPMKRNGKSRRKNNKGQDQLEKLFWGGDRKIMNRDTSIVCKIPGVITPKSIQVRLRFPDVTTLRTKTTSPVANWSIRSSAYDPDPSFGTGAIPGFSEWAAMYADYKVHGIGVDGQILNGDTQSPMYLVIRPYVDQIIANNAFTALSTVYENGANPLAIYETCSPNLGGQPRWEFRKFWNNTTVLGNNQWLTDDGYSSGTNSNPATMVYVLFAIARVDGANIGVGVYTHINVDMDVEFYNRKQQLA